ncbi:MAG TPA: QueT transporter family protein [Candidatus Deferrimicrobium sp.]|nr:QueT transporter family protein [Candidatus Deferrimicrobium sp.]
MAYFKNSLSYKIAIIAIFGALYAVLVYTFAPISFYFPQVRIADCLIPLSFIFGLSCAIGLFVGCFIGNFIGGLGPIDYIGGPIANFIAAYVGYQIEKRNKSQGIKRILRTQLAITVQTLINSFIVGSYLAFFFPFIFEDTPFLNIPPIVIGWLTILIGSLISMNFLGFLIYEALRKTGLYQVEEKPVNLTVAVEFITRKICQK